MSIDVTCIDNLLPQTQCGECGYAGCHPYAQALAEGSASIDKCPPGGRTTIEALAALLQINAQPYLVSADAKMKPPVIAVIKEDECIGCTKCIQACPVDAIIGTGKKMHVIIAHECTGCGLCVAPCPVDCIELQPIPQFNFNKSLARQRFAAKKLRLMQEHSAKKTNYEVDKSVASLSTNSTLDAKKEYVKEALARVQAKKIVKNNG